MGPKPSDECPYETCTEEPRGQEQTGARESWKGQAGASLEPQGSAALRHPDFSLWLQNCERTNFCCFKPPSLWQFVWPPWETKHIPILILEAALMDHWSPVPGHHVHICRRHYGNQ